MPRFNRSNLRLYAAGFRAWVTGPTIIAVLALSLLWALFFWRLLTPSLEDRVIFSGGDFTIQFFPFSNYQAMRMQAGQIPLWNPYNDAGSPFAADLQWGTWYPPRWIALFLAGPGGWKIETLQMEVAAHYWLASVLMYAFLRAITRHPTAALAGSIIFTYGGNLTSYPMQQVAVLESMVWLPLVLLGVHLSLSQGKSKIGGSLLGGLGLGLSLLGGHPQTTLHIIYIMVAYAAFEGWMRQIVWWGIVWRIGLTLGIGVGIGAVQWLPSLEYAGLASRMEEYHYAEKSSGFSPLDLAEIIWPNVVGLWWSSLYAGVASLLLALGALFHPRARQRFWASVLIISLVLSLGRNTIATDVAYLLAPGINLFRGQERFVFFFTLAMTVLAAYQVDQLLMGTDEGIKQPTQEESRSFGQLALGHLGLTGIAAFAVILLSITEIAAIPEKITSSLIFVALMSLFFTLWLRNRPALGPLVPVTLVALIVLDLFSIGTRSTNFVPDRPENRPIPLAANYLQTPPTTTWRVDGAAGLRGYSIYYRVPDIYGNSPLSLLSTTELRRIPVDRFWEVLSVRYATLVDVAPPQSTSTAPLATLQNNDGQSYVLYELTDPRPFAHLVYDYRTAGNQGFARQMMADPSVNLRETAITTHPLPFELSGTRPADGKISDFHMPTPEHIEMTISTSEDALLTLSIPNYPGWQAAIDGHPVEIVDTYAGLIGVPIQAGNGQIVQVDFVPRLVIIGGIVSGGTLLGMIVIALAATRLGQVTLCIKVDQMMSYTVTGCG
ncbi:MAG: YfhO family protein [Anaerolineae bacterium]|nr:YfhO family protein [Anaerolineae bacterium]